MRRLVLSACLCSLVAVAMVAPAADAPSFALASDAFTDGKLIPAEFTCDGADRSPPLHWDGAPEATKAFALVVEDPDAPGDTFTHWILYNAPGATKAFDEGVATNSKLGDGSMQGTNDFGKIGYAGPCPPREASHRYVFQLYALSEPVDLQPGAKRDAVLAAIKSTTLAKAKLTGTYKRGASKPTKP